MAQPLTPSKSSLLRSSDRKSEKELNKSFALSLACSYLNARDLLALSLTCTSVQTTLRTGSARTLRVDLRQCSPENGRRAMQLYSQSFPRSRELIVIGNRHQVFLALQGAARLKLTRLCVTLDEEEGLQEQFLDGLALSVEYGAFPLLERLDLRNVGPFSPRAFLRSCSGASLQMIRLTRCPTLMDSTLGLLINHAHALRELSLDECPSIVAPVIVSDTLVRLKLAKCFSLQRVNVNRCPNLMILDMPWTAHLVDPPSLSGFASIRYLSLAGAAKLERFEVERIPSTLSSIDLGCCTRLKAVFIGHCPRLVFLDVSYCVELESIILKHATQLEELDLSLLTNLKHVEVTDDYRLRRIVLDGCDKLHPKSVHCNEDVVLSTTSSRFRKLLEQ